VTASPERNKVTAMAIYDLMFNQNRPDEAIQRSVGRGTRH